MFFSYVKSESDSLKKYNNVRLKIDYTSNNILGYTKSQLLYGSKGEDFTKYFFVTFGTQFTFNNFKYNKHRIWGIYFDIGKELIQLQNGNINNYYFIKKTTKTIEVHFARTGVNYMKIHKNNFGYGGEFYLRKNIFLDILNERYVISDRGIVYGLTNGLINLDCSLAVYGIYKWKRNLICFKINFPNYFELEYFSWGITYLRTIFNVKKKN